MHGQKTCNPIRPFLSCYSCRMCYTGNAIISAFNSHTYFRLLRSRQGSLLFDQLFTIFLLSCLKIQVSPLLTLAFGVKNISFLVEQVCRWQILFVSSASVLILSLFLKGSPVDIVFWGGSSFPSAFKRCCFTVFWSPYFSMRNSEVLMRNLWWFK